MPIITIHATKGGQGTTTIAATLALLAARAGHRTLLIDTNGDLPAILDRPEPDRGLADYLTTPTIALTQLAVPITDHLELIARGRGPITFDTYTYGLTINGLGNYDTVIIDTATHADTWNQHADHNILVTRPDYLAIRRAIQLRRPPDHLIVITEPGRSLNARDTEVALDIPVTATIDHDPAIAQTIDAGLLIARTPAALTRALRHVIPATRNGNVDSTETAR